MATPENKPSLSACVDESTGDNQLNNDKCFAALSQYFLETAGVETIDEATTELLSSITDLVKAIALGDQSTAEQVLVGIGTSASNGLFDEVGKLTRRLHSSLTDFRHEVAPKLEKLSQGVPQATDQLNNVIEMTNAAAHKVLNLVEKQADAIGCQKQAINKGRDELLQNPLDDGIYDRIKIFSNAMLEELSKVEQANTDILMAQEFQDLSGQILKKVIKLITDVEDSLVALVRMFGLPQLDAEEQQESVPESSVGQLVPPGPAVDQNDVDDLLASLGF